MLLVCPLCGIPMRCQEIGVFVRDGKKIRSGDLYACPMCTESVIANFGEPFGLLDAPGTFSRAMAALETTGAAYVSLRAAKERF